ncbi:MAG: ABC transporter substrate-binding protein [Thermoplasmataceae archaeon]
MDSKVLIDHTGREVNVPVNPERIVSFSPAVTEILFELGLGGNIVGISAFCQRPKEVAGIRRVGSYGSARMEVLDEVRPDLILAISGYQKEFAMKLSERYPVFIFELPSSVAGILDLVSRVGIVTGRIDESKYMNFELMKHLGSVRRHPALTGYLEIDLGGPVSFGSMSYITDALSLMGVNSIYRKADSEWVQPSMDYVRESDPDVIFYEPKMYGKFDQEMQKKLIKDRKWESMHAVTQGRFFVTPGKLDFFAHHGPAFIREVMPWTMERLDDL